MFTTTFEILKDYVIERIRDFYTTEWDQDGPTIGAEHKAQVLARNNSAVYASLDWLRENQVVDLDDLNTFEKLKKTRNQLAHQLFKVVTGQISTIKIAA